MSAAGQVEVKALGRPGPQAGSSSVLLSPCHTAHTPAQQSGTWPSGTKHPAVRCLKEHMTIKKDHANWVTYDTEFTYKNHGNGINLNI